MTQRNKVAVDVMPTENFKGNFDYVLPFPATEGSAGLDLRSQNLKPLLFEPGQAHMIPTGIRMHIKDPNIAAMLLPRSGLGHTFGMVLGNLVGLLDSDYQGEVLISAWNRSDTAYVVEPQTKLAQMIFVPVVLPLFNVVTQFSDVTERGDGGFNSTGTS